MKVVTQNYIGTTEEWKAANPVLYNAVWGFEITERGGGHHHGHGKGGLLIKVGNGKDRWNDLKYLGIENIKELKEKLQELTNRGVAHDETLAGTGLEGNPLSVNRGAFDGITSRAVLVPDEETESSFNLPEDFMFSKLSIVTINGLCQEPGADYTLDDEKGTINFMLAPQIQDTVVIYYTQKTEEKTNEN